MQEFKYMNIVITKINLYILLKKNLINTYKKDKEFDIISQYENNNFFGQKLPY